MNIFELIFGKDNEVIDINLIQTDLKDIPYSDQERIRDAELDSRCNQYSNVQNNVPNGKRVC